VGPAPWFFDEAAGTVQWADELLATADRADGSATRRASLAQLLLLRVGCGVVELPGHIVLTEAEKQCLRDSGLILHVVGDRRDPKDAVLIENARREVEELVAKSSVPEHESAPELRLMRVRVDE
jgi:hypothetical protein